MSNLNFDITFLILMILIKKIGGYASLIMLDLIINEEMFHPHVPIFFSYS